MSKTETKAVNQLGGVIPETEIKQRYGLYRGLEDVHYKYVRLTSLIGILQQFVAEVVDVVGVPADSLANALYEIELGMDENNERLKELFMQKGGVA